MKARFSGLLAAPVALGLLVGACIEDPVSDLDTGPAYMVFNADQLDLFEGDVVGVIASVLDGRGRPLPASITFTACDADVTVAADATYDPVPNTSARAIVTAAAAGASCVVAAGGGVADTLSAVVLPVSFAGALSSTTPAGGSLMTIRATPVLNFNPATVSVTFGGGFVAPSVFKTADSVGVLVPFSDPGPLTIAGINVTYVPGLNVSLPTAQSVTQTGDVYGLADTSFATAPTIALPAAAGQSVQIISNIGPPNNTQCAEVVFGFGSSGPCMIYQFTVAAPTDLTFSTDWAPGTALAPDVDIYSCDDTGIPGCFEDGGGGATGSKPQEFTFTFPAGTHYFVVEIYSGSGARNIITTITQN
jgi:hypothetical protein